MRSEFFTGQTALGCAGGATATVSRQIIVSPAPEVPGKLLRVKVRCPSSAKPKGCLFRLLAVAAKPKQGHKAKPESALAKAKVKAGHSATITLRPKPAFATRLAAAKRILVRESVLVRGTTETRYLKLPVVR